ncbi:MAG: ABC transporter ATP-binding protein [Saprospiraceae bacterium]
MGFLEVIGIASILPFMELLAKPDAIEQSTLLTRVYEFFEFSSPRAMLIASGVAVIVLITISNLFGALTVWLQFNYSWQAAHSLATRLLRTYLRKPYSYFLNKNSAELKAYLVAEVHGLTTGVLIPFIELISRGVVAAVIFGLLLWVDFKVAITMAIVLGGAYLAIYFSQKQLLKSLGELRIEKNLLRYKTLNELLTGIKTVKSSNTQPYFYERYETASEAFTSVQPKVSMIMAAPRFFLEIFAFGSILGVTLYLFIQGGNIQVALPRLTLYAVAGYRLLPALQRAFIAASRIKHFMPALEKLQPDLANCLEVEALKPNAVTPLPFRNEFCFEGVYFQYENTEHPVLKDLNLQIEKGNIVAFVGSTGAGKTTLIDLMVGLLPPTTGAISIDNKLLEKDNLTAWQQQIAYVPQDVFLFDDSIARNIAMGKKDNEIDQQCLEMATKMADIYDFIQTELPLGFGTNIGERGVKLSGGQRQRIGLARALYRQPSVLVLDEATSALDTITEKNIIDSLRNLPKNMTIILIAHRLSTVKHANIIYLLEQGEIVEQGTYESLKSASTAFREMVKLS